MIVLYDMHDVMYGIVFKIRCDINIYIPYVIRDVLYMIYMQRHVLHVFYVIRDSTSTIISPHNIYHMYHTSYIYHIVNISYLIYCTIYLI